MSIASQVEKGGLATCLSACVYYVLACKRPLTVVAGKPKTPLKRCLFTLVAGLFHPMALTVNRTIVYLLGMFLQYNLRTCDHALDSNRISIIPKNLLGPWEFPFWLSGH